MSISESHRSHLEESPEHSLKTHHTEKEPDFHDFPDGGLRAWLVAAGCSGALFSTFGYANAFGVFQAYYETNQLSNEDPSTIAWIGSTQVFCLFAGGLVGGPLFDRIGAKTLVPSVVIYVLSVMLTSICKTYYQFMLAQGILGGLGMGMTMAPCMAATSQWFKKKRAAAIGFAVAGSSLGGVMFPIALSKMLTNRTLGFGWTVRICGFIMLALLIPSTLTIRARLPPRNEKFFLLSAFKEPQYVALLATVFLMLFGTFSPIFYLPSYAMSHGVAPSLSFYLTAILNGASFFGRVIPGITADKLGPFNVFAVFGIATGILCLCWQAVTTQASIIAFAALYGFCSGAIVSLMSVCLAHTARDPRNIGTYMGMGMFVVAFAALTGPPANGALVTRYKDFDQVSTLSGVVILVGALGIFLVKIAGGMPILGRN